MQQLLILAGAGLIAIGVLTKPKKSDSVSIPDANPMPTSKKANDEKSIDSKSNNSTSHNGGNIADDL